MSIITAADREAILAKPPLSTPRSLILACSAPRRFNLAAAHHNPCNILRGNRPIEVAREELARLQPTSGAWTWWPAKDVGFESPLDQAKVLRMSIIDLNLRASEICPGDPIEPGIVRAVAVLNDAGIATFESCEGGEGHASPVPVVRFYGGSATGWAALAACLDNGLPVTELTRSWDIDSGEPSGPFWKLVFSARLD